MTLKQLWLTFKICLFVCLFLALARQTVKCGFVLFLETKSSAIYFRPAHYAPPTPPPEKQLPVATEQWFRWDKFGRLLRYTTWKKAFCFKVVLPFWVKYSVRVYFFKDICEFLVLKQMVLFRMVTFHNRVASCQKTVSQPCNQIAFKITGKLVFQVTRQPRHRLRGDKRRLLIFKWTVNGLQEYFSHGRCVS